MQTDVFAFLTVNVDFGLASQSFLPGLLPFAVFHRHHFNDAADLVVTRPGRNALRKFALMIRHLLPVGMFPAHRMDRYPDPVYRAIIGPVSCAEDQSVLVFLLVVASEGRDA